MRLHVEMTRLLPPIVADLLRPLFGRRHAPESWHQVQGGILAGTWLHLSPSRMGQMLRGTYEQALVSAVVPLIRPGWICFDVGAHFGYYALLLAALVGERGAVHAFEPVPYNVRLLELHVAKNQKGSVIRIYPLALSDTNGTAVLRASNAGHSSGQAYLSGVRVVEIPVMRRFRTLRVEQRRLDDLVATGVVPRPHFIKIDVEGAEAAVLRGGLETLRTVRPVVAAELHTAANAAEAAGLLSAAGYQVRVVEDREATRCLIVATPEG